MFQPLYQKKSILRFKFSSLGKFPLPPPPPKSLQSCLTLCDPIDGSLPGSPVPGILQARIMEWVAMSFSNACMHAMSLQSCPTLCDPIDGSLPGSSARGIFQARVLEWVTSAFSGKITVESIK